MHFFKNRDADTLLLIRNMAIKCTKVFHHTVKCFIHLTKHMVMIKWKSMKTKKFSTMIIFSVWYGVFIEWPNKTSNSPHITCKIFYKFFTFINHMNLHTKPGIEQVQALTDISLLVLCCDSNETHALIANPPDSAQLEPTRHPLPFHSIPGPCSSA